MTYLQKVLKKRNQILYEKKAFLKAKVYIKLQIKD